MSIRSVLKPEGSIMASIATVGAVYGVYNISLGSVADATVTEPNHPALASARKKAGFTAFTLVSALSLITKDGNVATLGYATIIAMELSYRHAVMVDHTTGTLVAPTPREFQPAENVIPIGATADGAAVGY